MFSNETGLNGTQKLCFMQKLKQPHVYMTAAYLQEAVNAEGLLRSICLVHLFLSLKNSSCPLKYAFCKELFLFPSLHLETGVEIRLCTSEYLWTSQANC